MLFQQCMISFYKFVPVRKPPVVSSTLMKTWSWMGIKGRVYVAREGINAQLAVPEVLLSDFKDALNLRENEPPCDEDDDKTHVVKESLFKGVNHVFDGRMGEVITEDLLDRCINCGQECNVQTDCANVSCPRPFDRRIFVQCEECTARMIGACSNECYQSISASSSCQKSEDTLSTTTNTTSLDEQISFLQRERKLVTNNVTAKVRETNVNELYADTFSMDEEPLLTEVRRRTEEAFPNRMHVMSSHLQALFLKMLVQITGAKRVLEIGTFTGYATLYMASGMTNGGEVVTCEKDDVAANIAQECFVERTEQERERVPIHLLRGDADKTIRDVLKIPSAVSSSPDNQFDMAFVDADKGGYIRYLQMLLDDGKIMKVEEKKKRYQ